MICILYPLQCIPNISACYIKKPTWRFCHRGWEPSYPPCVCSPSDLLLFDVRFVHTFNCMTDIFGMHWVVLPPSRSTFLGMKEDEEGEKRNMRPSFLAPSRNAVEKQLTAAKLACCKCPTCLRWHLNPQPQPPPNNSGMMAYHDDVGGLPILAHNLDFNPTYLCCCSYYYYLPCHDTQHCHHDPKKCYLWHFCESAIQSMIGRYHFCPPHEIPLVGRWHFVHWQKGPSPTGSTAADLPIE